VRGPQLASLGPHGWGERLAEEEESNGGPLAVGATRASTAAQLAPNARRALLSAAVLLSLRARLRLRAAAARDVDRGDTEGFGDADRKGLKEDEPADEFAIGDARDVLHWARGADGLGREVEFAGPAYGAFKAALVHYAQKLAHQYAPKMIRVNAVSPGNTYFDGGVWQSAEKQLPDLYKHALSLNPTGRMATPEEVGRGIVFLASPASGFTKGTNLVIDGALTRGVQL
jgi:NAD(P)-dependent dehydrogenase (short-subunit alcohol dehydrogenase family)